MVEQASGVQRELTSLRAQRANFSFEGERGSMRVEIARGERLRLGAWATMALNCQRITGRVILVFSRFAWGKRCKFHLRQNRLARYQGMTDRARMKYNGF